MAGLKFKVILATKEEIEIVAMDLDEAVEYADTFYPTWTDVREVKDDLN